MLPSALVVFREVFEIVLIVGIVLAATKTMPRRKLAIALGFVGGIAGSALLALFTEQVSNFAEGMGQEYFNAGILLTAAAFIGWTVLWMKKHARHMKKHFEAVGNAVIQGKAPYIALSAIIATAMLREGSEIVLFTYGMLAAGQSALSIAGGAAIGAAGGLAVGLALYHGLIRLSISVFFRVTSAMLILLVAGMASQAFGFLVAAGAFENFSNVVWDSSFILSEHGFIGQSLGTLIGYTARPTVIQLIAYIGALAFMFGWMRMIEKNFSLRKIFLPTAAACFALALLPAAPAHATKNVTSPYVEKGELELEWKGGFTHDDDNEEKDGAWEQKAAIAYGLTERVQLEIEGEWEEEGDSNEVDFTTLALEGKVMLTERGEYWVDVGLKGEYAINMLGGPDVIEGKLLLAKDMGKFAHKANFKLEREVGEDSSDETEGGFAWSSKYRYSEKFEPGFEIHSGFGELSHTGSFDEQDHRLGPVIYGKLGSVKYDAGYLVGVSDDAPDGTAKVILEYERHF